MCLVLRRQIIPGANTGGAESVRMSRIRPMTDTPDSESVSVQFEFADAATMEKWQENVLTPLLENMSGRYGEAILVFNTILEQLDHES